MDALANEFGRGELIEERFYHKLESWPKIQDGKGLKLYSYFLNQCVAAMNTIPGLKSLDNKRENKKLISVLQQWLRDRWTRFVTDQESKQRGFPSFKMYAEFISHEAKVANNSLKVNVSHQSNSQPKSDKQNSQKPPNRITLPTQTEIKSNQTSKPQPVLQTAPEPQASKPDQSSPQTHKTSPINGVECEFCLSQKHDRWKHKTSECFALCKMDPQEVNDFLANSSLCFACCEKGHGYNKCNNRAKCKECGQNQPTVLHARYADKSAPALTPHGDQAEKQTKAAVPKSSSATQPQAKPEQKTCHTATLLSTIRGKSLT